jgi:hypothetical protein
MAHAPEAAEQWPGPCKPFSEALRSMLPPSVDARGVDALSMAEYQALAAKLRAELAETVGEHAWKRKLHAVLGKLLEVVELLYDYLKTTLLSSRNVHQEYGGLFDDVASALAHIAELRTIVREEHAGWDSNDTYTTMVADFR